MLHWTPNQPSENALPPEQARILNIRAEPWPDQPGRVRIYLEITPLQQRPNIEVTINDPNGNPVSNIHIIEILETMMTFTMHLKDEQTPGSFSLIASLAYPDIGVVDEKKVTFQIPQLNA